MLLGVGKSGDMALKAEKAGKDTGSGRQSTRVGDSKLIRTLAGQTARRHFVILVFTAAYDKSYPCVKFK
jgi:hypothetical protein